ncbi:fibrinogen-like YCDxxxxGGGW domain-containing protein [Colwellia sp. E150_009]
MLKNFPLLFAVIALNSFADSNISYLSIKNDAVYFSTTNAKQHTIPSCGAGENANLWAFSLDGNVGRARYSMLVTAIASKTPVSVNPANYCEVTGVEAPEELSFGTEGLTPIDGSIHASCDEIVKNDASAQDGVYSIRPNGAGAINVLCDMDVSGGWTLVMRGQEGSKVSNWYKTTADIRLENGSAPNEGTFKFADTTINLLVSSAYRVTTAMGQRYFKPTCVYNHTSVATGACRVSYGNINWGEPINYNYNNHYSEIIAMDYGRGLSDTFHLYDSRNTQHFVRFITTSTEETPRNSNWQNAMWMVGNAFVSTVDGYGDVNGQYMLNAAHSSFELWVK